MGDRQIGLPAKFLSTPLEYQPSAKLGLRASDRSINARAASMFSPKGARAWVRAPHSLNRGRRPSIVVDNRRRSIPAWQDRISDPSLTVLLVLQFCAIFVAAPLAAKGLPIARTVADTLVLAVLAVVVMLSRKWGAIVVILLGLAAYVASFLPPGEWSPVLGTIARHG